MERSQGPKNSLSMVLSSSRIWTRSNAELLQTPANARRIAGSFSDGLRCCLGRLRLEGRRRRGTSGVFRPPRYVGLAGLGRAPVVEEADDLHAGDGAIARAGLGLVELAPQILTGVLHQWNSGISPLLGAEVDLPVLADIKVAASGPAAPGVRPAVGEVLAKAEEARVALLAVLPQAIVDGH